jgi:(p)ppGpp synthase/HD superfamily hydrolase
LTDQIRLTKAYHLAAVWHAAHKRKGAAGEPYINHLTEVAELVALAGGDTDMIIAAILHDTIEDVGVTREQIAEHFGDRIASYVVEVTDDKSLPKPRRKELQVLNAPHKSPGARLIKVADKTSNLRSMRVSPPSHWDLERRKAYLAWARNVVAALDVKNDWLNAQFNEAARDLEDALG